MKALNNDELLCLSGGLKEELCNALAGFGLGMALFDIAIPELGVAVAVASLACL